MIYIEVYMPRIPKKLCRFKGSARTSATLPLYAASFSCLALSVAATDFVRRGVLLGGIVDHRALTKFFCFLLYERAYLFR